ncbi:hypothetical protein COU13_01485 [Candidatus Kaiserbacteria bacterium CG10_big_fil_rev_8_21_14_0_10_43_70]|uniref:Uncharacterized protein n=1 Tax=Candidatus Kaiserbacteria bacterium CG10_big_fil_rev_8_21_14_0_10_43_70 TaxID=1974605 RepID=A0A2H0UIX1_9BACT|nr:MAG: hypothetical protein COU13_01485 [Candidatus Kaiserbacteria bacterium CG10_big_fil_rev_8_21_14_0_10_43_70]
MKTFEKFAIQAHWKSSNDDLRTLKALSYHLYGLVGQLRYNLSVIIRFRGYESEEDFSVQVSVHTKDPRALPVADLLRVTIREETRKFCFEKNDGRGTMH